MSSWLCPVPDPELTLKAWPSVMLLAAVILGEAEGENFLGKRAVGQVIRNRVLDMRWPDTWAEVILQPFQFSAMVDAGRLNAMRRPKLHTTEDAWSDSFFAAVDTVRGEKHVASVGGSNHYLCEAAVIEAAGKLPAWFDESKVTCRIGNHTFLAL